MLYVRQSTDRGKNEWNNKVIYYGTNYKGKIGQLLKKKKGQNKAWMNETNLQCFRI